LFFEGAAGQRAAPRNRGTEVPVLFVAAWMRGERASWRRTIQFGVGYESSANAR